MNKNVKQILFIALIICLILPTFFFARNTIGGKETVIYGVIISLCFTFVVSILIVFVNTTIINKFHKSDFFLKHITKRLILEFLITSITSAIIMLVMIMIMHTIREFLPHKDYKLSELIFDNITIAVVINLFMMSAIEGTYFFKQWKLSLINAEKFKRETAEAQFAALKNQVNPHFLFNSLNALSSLISTNQEKAVEFVNVFSKVYRYVLDVKDNMIVSINNEMKFVNSYLYLQQLRYGENLRVNIKLDSSILNFSVPPMSIQMLIENAIKHNEISVEFPLQINISNDEKYIIVKNNLQKIETNDISLGIGIENLKERYKMITELPAEFYLSNNDYFTKIPIIKEE